MNIIIAKIFENSRKFYKKYNETEQVKHLQNIIYDINKELREKGIASGLTLNNITLALLEQYPELLEPLPPLNNLETEKQYVTRLIDTLSTQKNYAQLRILLLLSLGPEQYDDFINSDHELTIIVPKGMKSKEQLQVETPYGMVLVIIPVGVTAGNKFSLIIKNVVPKTSLKNSAVISAIVRSNTFNTEFEYLKWQRTLLNIASGVYMDPDPTTLDMLAEKHQLFMFGKRLKRLQRLQRLQRL